MSVDLTETSADDAAQDPSAAGSGPDRGVSAEPGGTRTDGATDSVASPSRRSRLLNAALRLCLAAVGGAALDLAFPAVGWWPFALIGTALILAALHRARFWAGCGVGVVAMLSFYFVHIAWASLYLGPIPWLALSAAQALIFAPFAGGLAATSRLLFEWSESSASRLVAYPLIAAAWWLTGETVTASWPYGGFSWGRLAFSHSEGWFAHAASWVGASGLSFLLAVTSALLFQVCALLARWADLRRRGQRRADDREVAIRSRGAADGDVPGAAHSQLKPWRAGLWIAAGWSAVLGLAAFVPVFPQHVDGTLRVAAVQGAGPAGYFATRQRGDLLAAQLDATEAGITGPVDVIVWPEDGSDLDPMRYPAAAAALSAVTERYDAPLVLGTITLRDELLYNSSLVWPVSGAGPTAIYDKKHPVPFGEYVPHRGFYERIVPNLIGLIAREYEPGTRSSVIPVGSARIGSAICFDIAYDDIARDIVRDRGQAIFAQSNNGDFGTTDESVQQLAIARLRAIETGRDLVNISTVGVSAIIRADGSTAAQLTAFEPGAMEETITLRSGETLGVTVAPFVQWGSAAGALLAALWLMIARRRRT